MPGTKAILILDVVEGQAFVAASMLGPSNDTFVATKPGGIDASSLIVQAPQDITSSFVWMDAGTEVNEPLGEGPNQVSNAPGTDSGQEEQGKIPLQAP